MADVDHEATVWIVLRRFGGVLVWVIGVPLVVLLVPVSLVVSMGWKMVYLCASPELPLRDIMSGYYNLTFILLLLSDRVARRLSAARRTL
jgi:hypothetical protein